MSEDVTRKNARRRMVGMLIQFLISPNHRGDVHVLI